MPPRLILASGSPQRRRLLAEAGYPFSVMVPHESAECGICSNCGPATLVTDLALKKAADVAARCGPEPAVLLACDTVAECGGMILGKPDDEEHARQILEHLRGTIHRVYSGLCLWRTDNPTEPLQRVAVSELEMAPLSDEQIDAYLETDLWRGKAGAFGIQDRPGWLRIVSGSESNIIGLPMEDVAGLLGDPGGYRGTEK